MTHRLLAVSWATLPMSAPRAMQVCRLLAHLPGKGWSAEIVTSRECADAAPEIAERQSAALYDQHYEIHEVEPREDRVPSSRIVREWRRWQSPASVHEANWIRRATLAASRHLRCGSFDALVTFAQPWSDHLVGLRLKRQFPEIPWLAHFSDPWGDNPYYAGLTSRRRSAAIAQEHAVVAAADRIVFVTEQTADLVMAKYPFSWRQKVRVIPHGFDLDLLEQEHAAPELTSTQRPASRMRITHTGSLYHGARPVSGLLQALLTLRSTGADVPVELSFIGYNPPELTEEIERLGLDDLFLLSGPRPWSESVRAAATADALLVIDAPSENSVFLPSKLVEYLALRKPILGLTPERGASSDLLRRLDYPVASPQDSIAIASRLQELLSQWRRGHLCVSPKHDQVAAEYDIRRVAERFAALLSEMTGLGQPGPQQTSNGVHREASSEPASAEQSPGGRVAELLAAVEAVARQCQVDRLLVVTPHSLSVQQISDLLEHPRVESLVVGKGSRIASTEMSARVGRVDMANGTWSLPNNLGQLTVFLEHPDHFGVRRSLSAIKRGIWSIVVPTVCGSIWEKRSTFQLLCRSLSNAARRRLPGLSPVHAAWLRRSRWEQHLERNLNAMLTHPPLLSPDACVSQRILLVNSSLGPGGTERQVVNTMLGMSRRGIHDISIICDYLTPGSHDFYATMVRNRGSIPVERSRTVIGERARLLEPHALRLKQIVHRLPTDLSVDVILYIAEFLVRRPAIVHAWQDDTSVKAGLAAAIVGVPRIVLSGRSVAPHHFTFHQTYMRSCYRALSCLPNVVLVNNSRAGAQDYESWLGLEQGRISVVHNGFDFAEFRHPSREAVAAYRNQLGIEPAQPVVGTIMRFSEEKRPLLWLQVAAHLAAQRRDLAFLMVGTGVMQSEVRAMVESLDLQNRLFLVGIEPIAALALSAMDVFLLTSRKEGLPNVLVEAQSLGVPVVSTDVGGAGETFEHGVTGRLVADDDPGEIAAAVLSTLENAPWRERASQLAPQFVKERFSIDRMLDEMLSLYRIPG